MKPILSTLILTLSFALSGLAQNWNLEWEKQSGNRNQDFYTDVAETADGALVVLGARGEGASSDLWLLCFDANGNKLWDRTFGSPEQDLPEKVLVLPNGELLILGKSGTGIQSHILLIQADAEGNELWTNAPESNKYCEAHDMCLLKEGGFLLAGGKGADTDHLFPWLAQFDQEGNLISEQNYGEVNGCLSSVKQLPNQDLILGGQSAGKSKNDCDMLVLRTDPNGQ